MTTRTELLDLCHRAGDPALDLVISAEGNVSARDGDDTLTIKASGCSLRTMEDQQLVQVKRSSLIDLLDQADVTDEQTAAAYRASRTDPTTTATPSVEAILHAVIYEETSAEVVVHTHPTAINMLLCSESAHLLVAGALFPDQIVVLGRHQLLIPYIDPGVPLARAVRTGLREFIAEHGRAPRVIYLVNHGLFVLAANPDEAMHITGMAVKAARVLHGAITAGGPVFLAPEHLDRIEGRPDEQYRRQVLAARTDAARNGRHA